MRLTVSGCGMARISSPFPRGASPHLDRHGGYVRPPEVATARNETGLRLPGWIAPVQRFRRRPGWPWGLGSGSLLNHQLIELASKSQHLLGASGVGIGAADKAINRRLKAGRIVKRGRRL